jgi:peptide/nickel transport system substrate-binding protein
MGKRVPYDPVKARELLKQAGYDNNLEFTMDCPNNRYINDEAICQAVVAMWAQDWRENQTQCDATRDLLPEIANGDTSVICSAGACQRLMRTTHLSL